ncbi:hypothetical protein THAOC_18776, partial [Thalassiosira oceanica]
IDRRPSGYQETHHLLRLAEIARKHGAGSILVSGSTAVMTYTNKIYKNVDLDIYLCHKAYKEVLSLLSEDAIGHVFSKVGVNYNSPDADENELTQSPYNVIYGSSNIWAVLTAISRPVEGAFMYSPNDFENPMFVFTEEDSNMGSTAEINGIRLSTDPPMDIRYEPRLENATNHYDIASVDLVIGRPGVKTADLIKNDFDLSNCVVAMDLATNTFHVQDFDCMACMKTTLTEVCAHFAWLLTERSGNLTHTVLYNISGKQEEHFHQTVPL